MLVSLQGYLPQTERVSIRGDAGFPPLAIYFTICYHGKFSHSRSKHMSVIMEIWQKNFTPRVSPFKVIGTDTYRSATYEFLLVFHSNYGPTSYRFRDKQ